MKQLILTLARLTAESASIFLTGALDGVFLLSSC